MGHELERIHIVRDRHGTNQMRAYVTLKSVEDAVAFMEEHYPEFFLSDLAVRVNYSFSQTPETAAVACKVGGIDYTPSGDWYCPQVCLFVILLTIRQCGAFNFKKRDSCFKCFVSKSGTNFINDYMLTFISRFCFVWLR